MLHLYHLKKFDTIVIVDFVTKTYTKLPERRASLTAVGYTILNDPDKATLIDKLATRQEIEDKYPEYFI
jgi:hypothetical protein